MLVKNSWICAMKETLSQYWMTSEVEIEYSESNTCEIHAPQLLCVIDLLRKQD